MKTPSRATNYAFQYNDILQVRRGRGSWRNYLTLKSVSAAASAVKIVDKEITLNGIDHAECEFRIVSKTKVLEKYPAYQRLGGNKTCRMIAAQSCESQPNKSPNWRQTTTCMARAIETVRRRIDHDLPYVDAVADIMASFGIAWHDALDLIQVIEMVAGVQGDHDFLSVRLHRRRSTS